MKPLVFSKKIIRLLFLLLVFLMTTIFSFFINNPQFKRETQVKNAFADTPPPPSPTSSGGEGSPGGEGACP